MISNPCNYCNGSRRLLPSFSPHYRSTKDSLADILFMVVIIHIPVALFSVGVGGFIGLWITGIIFAIPVSIIVGIVGLSTKRMVGLTFMCPFVFLLIMLLPIFWMTTL